MFRNYLTVAIRNLLRHRVYSFINIAGLAVGMACCILIMLWVLDELGYDSFHVHADRICRVIQADYHQTPAPLAPTLVAEYPEITHATRILWRRWKLSHADRFFAEQGALVDPSFFEMFSFPLVRGESRTALSDLKSIVITEQLAQKLFAGEDPLGETITAFNQLELTVTGVMENIPRETHFPQFDWIIPFGNMLTWGWDMGWEAHNFKTYVMLREGASIEELSEKTADIIRRHVPENSVVLRLQPLKSIHLYGLNLDGSILYVTIFSTTALLILLIACMNFMNLATARASTRAREVGIRKVVGARRGNLIAQFLGESLLSSCLALVLGLVLVELALPTKKNL